MKRDLIEKLLNEQTTPEEEHLVAKMLQQEDMEQWLVEDETEEYDRIVNKRRAKLRVLRWAMAAAIAILLAGGAIVLWPQQAPEPQVVTTGVPHNDKPNDLKEEQSQLQKDVQQPVLKKVQAKATRRRRTSTTDSLQYYIARLEKELDEVTDSINYTAKAEQIIRADARLQKMIQRIMIGELTKDDQYTESMNMTKEERP